MAKIYPSKKLNTQSMKPKKEIVSFLLNYSKALTMVQIKKQKFEIIAN